MTSTCIYPCDRCGITIEDWTDKNPMCQKCSMIGNIHCSLCSMTFDSEDSLYKERVARHTIWHNKAQVQHRNTTQGEPTFD